MQEYHAYLIAPDGRVEFIALFLADEETAKDRVRPFACEHDVELWHGDRKVAAYSRPS
ncbi:hypothetical protein JQ628_05350 [Bradyrhizobium lablabi]|uniref:hypothetical protein n=1 Tax=Bradyrhizobium lablabi TaxID=722472 RepID=UPI001BA8792B|nr:hypothetical protein [Bradyrhizobium lablabi]MBR1120934.1 hypothetical protein [Bradyrhizobium lablabi]